MRISIVAAGVLVLSACAFKPYCSPHLTCPLNHTKDHSCKLQLDCGIKIEGKPS